MLWSPKRTGEYLAMAIFDDADDTREIQLADDAKREAEARKVTEGQYRTKRRGKDFYSDDEDGTPRKKRWSKKQMRQRRDWKEDGLERLGTSLALLEGFVLIRQMAKRMCL